MHSEHQTVAVGLTQTFPCSYLADQQEQLLVIKEQMMQPALFEQLLSMGFRRSGSMVYKPRCPHCQACQPIRVPLAEFTPSKRQKRTLAQNRDIRIEVSKQFRDAHYQLYQRYINARHHDGPMFPPTLEQYVGFIGCDWMQPGFVELYLDEQLVGVAVTDLLADSLSAVYSFFDPDLSHRSLGSLMILQQCKLGASMNKSFLYLGYQIDDNKKMNYKRLYRPYQVLTSTGWLNDCRLPQTPLHRG
ncbi:arginyltransferase [Shewanella avicenniae]|uniref:Aspartate/glutamate leucyltransferase n=1 Tax=Shewanella avicenniae TaxID=2814294 RepID=A0ABX7QMS1_9GAMM|nr:arginyltransferase [Shewanella avicenniae]QSX32190.1 arginyltransferase [Shewanella avicenniae]